MASAGGKLGGDPAELKKEARARARAQRAASAEGGGGTPPPSDAAAEGEKASPEDLVARALGRWGAFLGDGVGSVPAATQVGCTRHVIDGKAPEGTCNTGMSPQLWPGDRSSATQSDRRDAAATDEEVECVAQEAASPAAEDLGRTASALDIALDRAAGVLPLPDVSGAQALIRDLLPSWSHSVPHLDGQDAEANEEQPAAVCRSAKKDGEYQLSSETSCAAAQECFHSPQAVVSGCENSVFHEFSLERPGRALAPTSMGKGTSSKLADIDSKSAISGGTAKGGEADVAAIPESSMTEGGESGSATEGHKRFNAEAEGVWDSQGRSGTRRPLDALRAKDWRARRVSRAAVEIDMSLSRAEAGGNGATVRLDSFHAGHSEATRVSMGEPINRTEPLAAARQVLPDLGAVLSVHRRPDYKIGQDARAATWDQGGSPSAGVLLDEEMLAAERLGEYRTRAAARSERPPDPSNYTGAYELGMQRAFSEKWRRELLPIGASAFFDCRAVRYLSP